jgi:UDP-glucuronate decarboxylase
MQKVTLVTGGAGFIGSHLIRKLLQMNHRVIVIDNFLTGKKENLSNIIKDEGFSLLEKDVITLGVDDVTAITDTIDQIYHLASPASPNHHSPVSYHSLPLETMLVNSTGTMKMLEIAEKYKAKFLFSSTSEAYGDPQIHPQPETYNGNVSTTGPRSVYDEAKRFGETITAYFGRSRGVDVRIARIFNTYGPMLSKADMRMVINFIRQALTGQDITIFGDGKQTRSLCYVDDTISGLYALMENEMAKGEIVNIGSIQEHTVREHAEMIRTLTNSTSQIKFAEKLPENDPQVRRADITKAKKLLNWQPQVMLEEGLGKTIDWVRSDIITS